MVIIRIFLLFFCLLGTSQAMAAVTVSENNALPPLTVSITTASMPTELCTAHSTEQSDPASSHWHTNKDLSHDIHVNGVSLRFAHGALNEDESWPSYALVYEFAILPNPLLALGYVEPFTAQLNWPLYATFSKSRLAAWKDSNLQYIPQQYAPFFA